MASSAEELWVTRGAYLFFATAIYQSTTNRLFLASLATIYFVRRQAGSGRLD